MSFFLLQSSSCLHIRFVTDLEYRSFFFFFYHSDSVWWHWNYQFEIKYRFQFHMLKLYTMLIWHFQASVDKLKYIRVDTWGALTLSPLWLRDTPFVQNVGDGGHCGGAGHSDLGSDGTTQRPAPRADVLPYHRECRPGETVRGGSSSSETKKEIWGYLHNYDVSQADGCRTWLWQYPPAPGATWGDIFRATYDDNQWSFK